MKSCLKYFLPTTQSKSKTIVRVCTCQNKIGEGLLAWVSGSNPFMCMLIICDVSSWILQCCDSGWHCICT